MSYTRLVGKYGGDTPVERGTIEKAVGFSLDDVAQPLQKRIARKVFNRRGERLAGDGCPADDASDDRGLGRKFQQPVSLLERLAGLDRDRSVDVGRRGHRFEVVGKKSRRRTCMEWSIQP